MTLQEIEAGSCLPFLPTHYKAFPKRKGHEARTHKEEPVHVRPNLCNMRAGISLTGAQNSVKYFQTTRAEL